jgi:hypothetical protein
MLTVYYAAVAALQANRDIELGADFEPSVYLSLFGLAVTLAFLRLSGPGAFVLLGAT